MDQQKSKSQVKREMLALQELGEELLELSAERLNGIPMDEDLRQAVLFAKGLTKRGARRRQIQYIGTLMRDVDEEPIRQALENIARGNRLEAQAFAQVEKWRDGLLEGNDALMDEITQRFPHADLQQLRQLVRNARKEKEHDKPPKSSRALFRYLRELSKTSQKIAGKLSENSS